MPVDYSAARHNMVESQLRTNKVTDLRLLEGFEALPRESFVPAHKRGVAYVDEDIAVAPKRYLMEPMVLARLLQAAAVGPGDIVLEIGCGTGYAAALLARMAATVVALESDAGLAQAANETLSKLEIDSVVVVTGDLAQGYPKQAPYNVILISGAVTAVPGQICDQLAEGGRLITVLRDGPGLGRAVLMRKGAGHVSRRFLFDAATPFLPGFVREAGFVF